MQFLTKVLKSIFHVFQIYIFAGKMNSNAFVKHLTFIMGFAGNCLGQNVRNDRGIISGFHTKCHFDMCSACQSPSVLENINFLFLCSKNIFLFGGQACEALVFLEYRM